jgi:hypothetical protein
MGPGSRSRSSLVRDDVRFHFEQQGIVMARSEVTKKIPKPAFAAMLPI